jgi:hypothetical protein
VLPRDTFPIIGYAGRMTQPRNETTRERAPLLRVFGDNLAGRVAALRRARPVLIARLVVAPREAVHAIGAFLYLAPDAARSDAKVATIINDSDPRDLLRAALPGCPPRLYRALDRAGDHVRDRRFYERLGEVASSPLGPALLEGGALDDARLSYFVTLRTMDPVVASLRSALPESKYHIEAVDSLISFLRAHGALTDGDLRLPPRAGLAALVRRLQRTLGRIPAPDPGFLPPPPYRQIRSTTELQRIGRSYGNCLSLSQWHGAQHWFHLLRGTAVYLISDKPPLLVALRRVGGGIWLLDQQFGPRNAAPPRGARSALLRDLTAAGLRIVTTDPQDALARLESEAGRKRDAADDHADGEEDDLDDTVEEYAA